MTPKSHHCNNLDGAGMRTISLSKTVSAPARVAFLTISDTSSYGTFLPCSVETEPHDPAVPCRRSAILKAGSWPFSVEIATENSFDPPRAVGIRLAKPGTMSRFEAVWEIRPLAHDSCEVSFRAGYSFSSAAAEAVLGPVVGALLGTVSESFALRAEKSWAQELSRKA